MGGTLFLKSYYGCANITKDDDDVKKKNISKKGLEKDYNNVKNNQKANIINVCKIES